MGFDTIAIGIFPMWRCGIEIGFYDGCCGVGWKWYGMETLQYKVNGYAFDKHFMLWI